MYKKGHVPQSALILAMALAFYDTNEPANWLKFDKDISPDRCWKNLKKYRTYLFNQWE